MTDWIRDHAWAAWLGVAVVLAVVEMLSLDLVLLMFAIGALAAAAAAGLGAPVFVTVPLFAIVSLLLRAGTVVAQGPIAQTLTAENLSSTFGQRIHLDHEGGRFAARRAGYGRRADRAPATLEAVTDTGETA